MSAEQTYTGKPLALSQAQIVNQRVLLNKITIYLYEKARRSRARGEKFTLLMCQGFEVSACCVNQGLAGAVVVREGVAAWAVFIATAGVAPTV